MASADSVQFIAPDEIRKPWYVKLRDLIRRQPLGTAGAFVVILMVLATIFAEVLSPYDPEMISFESMLVPPSIDHWMGTDAFGRDIRPGSSMAHGLLCSSVSQRLLLAPPSD